MIESWEESEQNSRFETINESAPSYEDILPLLDERFDMYLREKRGLIDHYETYIHGNHAPSFESFLAGDVVVSHTYVNEYSIREYMAAHSIPFQYLSGNQQQAEISTYDQLDSKRTYIIGVRLASDQLENLRPAIEKILKSADMPHAASFNFPTVTHHTACSCLHDPFETLAIQVDQDDVEKTIKLMNDWVDSIAPTSIRRGSIPGASPISSGLHNFPCMYVHKSTVVEKNRLVEAGVPKDISYEKALARCYQAGLVNEKTAKNRKATHDYRLLTREEREAEVTERLLKDEEARAKIVGLDATTEDVAAAVKMTFLKRLNRRIETYGLDKNHIAFALKKVN